ncbi:hypothetical protein NRB20_07350 [Nocardia sp. RB20]|uniref:Uncharacterized protein n=1 Tax=Nocardia macrotermitis TaxID=2585198 RepID=A0A7K0CW92_9NOCA|nr:hypothetical protein [Nocardia macrotermitis]
MNGRTTTVSERSEAIADTAQARSSSGEVRS